MYSCTKMQNCIHVYVMKLCNEGSLRTHTHTHIEVLLCCWNQAFNKLSYFFKNEFSLSLSNDVSK